MKVDLTWFNASLATFNVFGSNVKLYNLFNRQDIERGDGSIEHHWGIGLLQIGGRHLLYVGSIGCTVLFAHKTNEMFSVKKAIQLLKKSIASKK